MKRSTFLLIAAVIGFLLGLTMFFAPEKTAEGFGVTPNPIIFVLFRAFGVMIFGSALLNFMVRNHADSLTLKAILLSNIVVHLAGIIPDVLGVSEGVLQLGKVLPGQIVHAFVGLGSLYYWSKMKS